MLTFKCKKNGEPFETNLYQYIGKENTSPEVRETANKIWENLNRDSTVTELRGLLPDGTVKLPPENKPMTWEVWGRYTEEKNGKPPTLYPFECDISLKENQKFISMPNGIPAITIVASCRWTERKTVIADCKGRKLFKIKQLVSDI